MKHYAHIWNNMILIKFIDASHVCPALDHRFFDWLALQNSPRFGEKMHCILPIPSRDAEAARNIS